MGESFEQCAYREVLEETGLKCTELEFFMLASGEKMHYTYPNGDEVYIAEATYICKKYEGDLKVQEKEALEQRFFGLMNLPSNISPVNVEVIERLKHEIKGSME